MPATLEDITQKAMQLPPHQRLALAGFLLEVDDASNDPAVIEAWEQELRSRIQAIDEGAIQGIPYEAVLQAAEQRLAP